MTFTYVSLLSDDLYPQPWETECVVEEFPYKILYGDCCGKKGIKIIKDTY